MIKLLEGKVSEEVLKARGCHERGYLIGWLVYEGPTEKYIVQKQAGEIFIVTGYSKDLPRPPYGPRKV